MKISKIALFTVFFVFLSGFFQMSFAKVCDKAYWVERISCEYSDRELSCTDSVAHFRARASYMDEATKKIRSRYSVASLRSSRNLFKELLKEFDLEYEVSLCMFESLNDYEFLNNLENIRDAYNTINLFFESARGSRRYSI